MKLFIEINYRYFINNKDCSKRAKNKYLKTVEENKFK